MARPSFYASDMSSDSAPAPQQPDLAAAPPGLAALFLAFAGMSLAGFGGVLVFARRAIVEQHRWMTADEFNETFALCHFLPGPNIVNLSMVFGSRLRGIAGGVAAFAGLLLPPTLIMMVLAIAYAHFGDLEVLRRILAGISCAAIGLLIAVVLRMMTPLLKRTDPLPVILMLGVFLAVGVLRLPLQAVLLVAIPVSVGVTYFLRRKVAA
jgi:chromate transporter